MPLTTKVKRPVGKPMSTVTAREMDVVDDKPEVKAKPVKKGKKSWKPASTLEVDNPDLDGYRLRWVHKESGNLSKKHREGWVEVNSVTGLDVEHVSTGNIQDGAKLTSLQDYRDMVLMAIPEETALARDEFYQTRTDQQMMAPKSKLYNAARQSGGDRAAHTVQGSVKIGRTVVE